jgi:hypothetical protein
VKRKTFSAYPRLYPVRPSILLSLPRVAVFAFAVTAGLTQPVFATPTLNQLIITENSPTDLSATYNGSPLTVMTFGADGWNVLPPSGVVFNIFIPRRSQLDIEQLGFTEPENPKPR